MFRSTAWTTATRANGVTNSSSRLAFSMWISFVWGVSKIVADNRGIVRFRNLGLHSRLQRGVWVSGQTLPIPHKCDPFYPPLPTCPCPSPVTPLPVSPHHSPISLHLAKSQSPPLRLLIPVSLPSKSQSHPCKLPVSPLRSCIRSQFSHIWFTSLLMQSQSQIQSPCPASSSLPLPRILIHTTCSDILY